MHNHPSSPGLSGGSTRRLALHPAACGAAADEWMPRTSRNMTANKRDEVVN